MAYMHEHPLPALARSLRLSDAERDLLFRLAGLSAPGPGVVPTRITASVQRLLDRFAGIPVVVYDAAWNLVVANAPYDALMGETSALRGNERNGVWRSFLGGPNRVVHTPESWETLRISQVCELRATAARYPADQRLRRLIAELRAESPLFAELWDSRAVAEHDSSHKTIDHPQLGLLSLDCDLLRVDCSDLRIMVFTAEPGSEDAEKLALLSVIGTQSMAGG